MKTKMKRLFLVFLLFFSAVLSLSAKSKKSDIIIMYVSVSNLPLKSKASILGPEIYNLEYGKAVFVLDQKKSWSKISLVNNEEITGWVNTKSLTKKKLSAADGKVTTNTDELALAGKGFSKAYEDAYIEEYNVDFSKVDSIESYAVSENDIVEFIKEGELNIPE